MALREIPVLSTEYPLFDWNDYPGSLEALVQNGLVTDFPKETWNAIIQKLETAFTLAGLSWDSKYTSASEAKIIQAYGALSAEMFNSVRHNIDYPAPLGWKWATDKTFRGYLGREDFRGFSKYGKDSDYVYSEYIVELVRKLNLLLELMRGTKGEYLDLQLKSLTEFDTSVIAGISTPLSPISLSNTTTSDFLRIGTSIPIPIRGKSVTLPSDFLKLYNSTHLNLHRKSKTSFSDFLSLYREVPLSIQVPSMTLVSDCIKVDDSVPIVVQGKSKTLVSDFLSVKIFIPMRFEDVSKTLSNSSLTFGEPNYLKSQDKSKTLLDLNARLGDSVSLDARSESKTLASNSPVVFTDSVAVSSDSKSGTKVELFIVSKDSARLPVEPQQSSSYSREEFHFCSGARLHSSIKSGTKYDVTLIAPRLLYMNGINSKSFTLNLGKLRASTNQPFSSIHTSLTKFGVSARTSTSNPLVPIKVVSKTKVDFSTKTMDPNSIRAKHKSFSKILDGSIKFYSSSSMEYREQSCTKDFLTIGAWYLPIFLDDGSLYIRQAFDAVPTNEILEVI